MPKKTIKRRKSTKVTRKSTSFNKFLTFPVITVIFFVLLSIITLFLVMQPDSGVLGVADSGPAPFIK